MLTVLTHLWKQPGGRARYTHEHVNIWADGVSAHLSMPHELACVTDMPEGIDPRIRIIAPPRDFEDVRIPSWPEHLPQCLRRLSLFRPDAAEVYGTERFVNMDLDVVIGGPLDPLFDRDDDIVLYRGMRRSRPYNGSMLMMTAGARPKVFTTFDAEEAERASAVLLGSDQAWISHVLGAGESVWTRDDGVEAWTPARRDIYDREATRLLFFPCPVKPWELVADGGDAWVTERYRRHGRKGRCLILGSRPRVWHDALKAGDGFDMVIASREAAQHRDAPGWRWGNIDAVAHDDAALLRIAAMFGFTDPDITFCGRGEG